ncbi:MULTISPECIES: Na+/H+ antiporter subunit E [unclassified Corynebacterium]|uniref:Na+/H+ antiporter subunit E n=1 Tax=unclassified Corynebacterium TaxID=2624378 RepID=UPI001C445A99|nr:MULTISPECIES: Na+/H+ antiporter subunit E [unclassified Corynebacterium]MBV7282626.1 Na+/H+ antiporter subunit E [Corynebacterium sp. TAE3-ERU30]MBV7302025.1 Na+/H+ antiporter subunit E [Corynebacterium sp. TAE3-ERU2]
MIEGFKRRFRPLSVVLLAIIWVMLYGEITPGNILAGLGIGVAVTVLLPLPSVPMTWSRIAWWQLLRLAGAFVGDLVVSSARVAWIALRPGQPPRSAIVYVPMRVQDEFVFALAATVLNLTPGGSVCDLDVANRRMVYHVLDGRSPAAIAAAKESVRDLEKRLIAIFESDMQKNGTHKEKVSPRG